MIKWKSIGSVKFVHGFSAMLILLCLQCADVESLQSSRALCTIAAHMSGKFWIIFNKRYKRKSVSAHRQIATKLHISMSWHGRFWEGAFDRFAYILQAIRGTRHNPHMFATKTTRHPQKPFLKTPRLAEIMSASSVLLHRNLFGARLSLDFWFCRAQHYLPYPRDPGLDFWTRARLLEVTVPYGTIGYHMVPYGTIWYLMEPYGKLWYLIVTSGTIWYYMVPYGTIWYHRLPYGTIWYHKVPYGPIGYPMLP